MRRSRTAFASVALVALALAGCGSSNNAASTAATETAATSSATAPGGSASSAPTTYHVNLAGFSKGSPNGSGLAVVTVNPPKGELCWMFSELTNVPSPTVARLFRSFPGATGAHGFLLGHTYKPSGCIHLEPGILELINSKPQRFFVNIHDAQFPEGAIRGPLSL
jgi:hypothetical protein